MKRFLKGMGKKWIVVAAAVVMCTATAVSYVFWNAGINNPANQTQDLTVMIGEGKVVETTLSLDCAVDAAGVLVPIGITAAGGETNMVSFSVNAQWDATAGQDAAAIADVDNAPGTLVVTLTGITNEPSGANIMSQLIGKQGVGTANLFIITYRVGANNMTANANGTSSGIAIAGNDGIGVDVVIEVEMRIPRDKDVYDLVAGKSLAFTFQFAVTNPDAPSA
jgi:hypothetical protein